MSNPADALKVRLRDDLRDAMRARHRARITAIRTLIAALDNAEAVPVPNPHAPYAERDFGDPGVEVPRRTLDDAAVQAIVAAEAEARRAVAAQLASGPHADALIAEVEIVELYLAGTDGRASGFLEHRG